MYSFHYYIVTLCIVISITSVEVLLLRYSECENVIPLRCTRVHLADARTIERQRTPKENVDTIRGLYIPHECERSIRLRNMQGVARGAISSRCGIVSNVGPFIRRRLDRKGANRWCSVLNTCVEPARRLTAPDRTARRTRVIACISTITLRVTFSNTLDKWIYRREHENALHRPLSIEIS